MVSRSTFSLSYKSSAFNSIYDVGVSEAIFDKWLMMIRTVPISTRTSKNKLKG